MSLELFTGKPGSGKSLDACREIKWYLKHGRDVIANFQVAKDDSWPGRFWYVPNSQFTPDVLVSIAADYFKDRKFRENGVLVVADEAQLLWNSRLWSQDKDRMAFLELMSQHRKYGMRVILVCQSDIMIDRQFRTLVEYEVNHRKISSLGAAGKFFKILSLGEIFYAVKTYYGLKVKVDGYFFRYRKSLGEMYNSYTTFQQLKGGPQGPTSPGGMCDRIYNSS